MKKRETSKSKSITSLRSSWAVQLLLTALLIMYRKFFAKYEMHIIIRNDKLLLLYPAGQLGKTKPSR